MRAALVMLVSVVIVGVAFVAVFAVWQQQSEARAFSLGVPYTNYNWNTAHAGGRGCEACHGARLAEDVSRLVVSRPEPELHGIFMTSYDIPMRVEDCLICHGGKTALPFAESIHALHLNSVAFVNMGGNCESCHAMMHGTFVLYDDETRYTVLNGVENLPTPAFTASTARTVTRLLSLRSAAH